MRQTATPPPTTTTRCSAHPREGAEPVPEREHWAESASAASRITAKRNTTKPQSHDSVRTRGDYRGLTAPPLSLRHPRALIVAAAARTLPRAPPPPMCLVTGDNATSGHHWMRSRFSNIPSSARAPGLPCGSAVTHSDTWKVLRIKRERRTRPTAFALAPTDGGGERQRRVIRSQEFLTAHESEIVCLLKATAKPGQPPLLGLTKD